MVLRWYSVRIFDSDFLSVNVLRGVRTALFLPAGELSCRRTRRESRPLLAHVVHLRALAFYAWLPLLVDDVLDAAVPVQEDGQRVDKVALERSRRHDARRDRHVVRIKIAVDADAPRVVRLDVRPNTVASEPVVPKVDVRFVPAPGSVGLDFVRTRSN